MWRCNFMQIWPLRCRVVKCWARCCTPLRHSNRWHVGKLSWYWSRVIALKCSSRVSKCRRCLQCLHLIGRNLLITNTDARRCRQCCQYRMTVGRADVGWYLQHFRRGRECSWIRYTYGRAEENKELKSIMRCMSHFKTLLGFYGTRNNNTFCSMKPLQTRKMIRYKRYIYSLLGQANICPVRIILFMMPCNRCDMMCYDERHFNYKNAFVIMCADRTSHITKRFPQLCYDCVIKPISSHHIRIFKNYSQKHKYIFLI